MKVRITKIGTTTEPLVETALKKEYTCGAENDKSPFVEYYVEGELYTPLMVGSGIGMLRDNRNGEKVTGTFMTSPVTNITTVDGEIVFNTTNSIYKMVYI